VKCLVTGASGFVGRRLCQQLAVDGQTVIALSRQGTPLPDGTATLALDLATHEPDGALLSGVDVVYHLAGIAHQQAQESAYQQLNYQATVALARLAAAARVKCFVFVSSVKAMGAPDSVQFRREDDCTVPVDPYSLSKWQAECVLREEFAESAMSVIILRPALVYGPGAKGNLGRLAAGVRRGMPRPPAGGARSMIAVQDLVGLLCKVTNDPAPGVQTWIACGDHPYSVRAIYDLMRTASGKGAGVAWLPRWGWRLGAALLDLLSPGGNESTFDKLFGTELYSNAAVLAHTAWRPSRQLEDVIDTMLVGGGTHS
jgi:nucleoside-diphosphate-sugar epimerase